MVPNLYDEVVDQLAFWWDTWFWPRLDGLTDDEYFWEPAPGAWSVRAMPDGGYTIDWAVPAPSPPPRSHGSMTATTAG